MKAIIETSFEGLVVSFHSVLDTMARSDRFRVETVKERGIGDELDGPLEERLHQQWCFVSDAHAGLETSGGNMPHFDGEVAKAWLRLEEGHRQRPWTTGFGGMERVWRRIDDRAAARRTSPAG